MSKQYTKEDILMALSMGFHAGVEAGEKGIPDGFVSLNPPHMEWYSQESLKFQNELLTQYEFVNGEIIKKDEKI